MAIMSEGLPQKLKCIKMDHEERGFQAFLTQPPFAIFCLPCSSQSFDGYPFTIMTLQP